MITNPWRAMRLADEWAASKGLPAAERAEALVESAQLRAQIGDYAGAEAALEDALKAKPGDAYASWLLAEAVRDRPEKALPLAEAAAAAKELSPSRRSGAYKTLTQIRLDLGDAGGARDAAAKAVEAQQGDVEAMVLFAGVRSDHPDGIKFARAACEAARAQPSWRRAAALRVCARGLADAKDYDGAMTALGEALGLDLDEADTLSAMTRVRRLSPSVKLPAVALPAPEAPANAGAAKAALAKDPDDLEALRVLVAAETAAGRKKEAASLAERFGAAARRAPNWQQVDAFRLNTRQWIALGDLKKAHASLYRAEDLAPASVENQKLIGRTEGGFIAPALSEAYTIAMKLRLALGDAAGADATLERGLAVMPENMELLRMMITRKLEQNKAKDALPYAERMVAAAKKASSFWNNPEKRGVVNHSGPGQAELDDAQQLLDNVRARAH